MLKASMIRPQSCPYPPALPASPLSFSALSVNVACPDPVGVLRKTRSLITQIDLSAPLLSHRHSPHAAIPFRITSFADPHHLTPIESHLCKKWGRGWGIQRFHHTQALPLSSTASKHPAAHSNARISTLFTRLLHSSLDTRGWKAPWLTASPTTEGSDLVGRDLSVLRITGHSSAQLSNLPAFKHFNAAFPLFTAHHSLHTGLPHNFYPPARDLRHNPAAQGQHPQPIPQTGRIQ
jgi:hypothetical protein